MARFRKVKVMNNSPWTKKSKSTIVATAWGNTLVEFNKEIELAECVIENLQNAVVHHYDPEDPSDQNSMPVQGEAIPIYPIQFLGDWFERPHKLYDRVINKDLKDKVEAPASPVSELVTALREVFQPKDSESQAETV